MGGHFVSASVCKGMVIQVIKRTSRIKMMPHQCRNFHYNYKNFIPEQAFFILIWEVCGCRLLTQRALYAQIKNGVVWKVYLNWINWYDANLAGPLFSMGYHQGEPAVYDSQMIFLKHLSFHRNHKRYSIDPYSWQISIGLVNDSVPNRRQAIILTKDDLVPRRKLTVPRSRIINSTGDLNIPISTFGYITCYPRVWDMYAQDNSWLVRGFGL